MLIESFSGDEGAVADCAFNFADWGGSSNIVGISLGTAAGTRFFVDWRVAKM